VSEAQLSILNYAFLALLYLFFARVLWAVWSEVRGPRIGNPQPANARGVVTDPTSPAARPPAPVKVSRSARKGVPSRLIVLQPKVRKGAGYPLAEEITLGRADSCSIGLGDDTFASQLHARVFRSDAKVWVEDLGSTNGTHLNGARLTAPVQLAIGDRLQVGNTIFEAQ
jgi:pSer/pThr/pTyr-binding forkhead associated (FHA) protein